MQKRVVALDIETIADPSMISSMPEVKANGNLKDPEKILKDIEEKKKKQKAEMSFEPMLNLICSAAWTDDNGSHSILLEEETHEAEKELLLKYWEGLSRYDHFVTFNGRDFDLRCMLLHGMRHGIRPSVSIDKGRYNRGNHTDLRPVLAGEGRFAKGKLGYFAEQFLGRGKTEGIDGAQVAFYWEMGLKEEIAHYNEEDTEITLALYRKAEAAGLLE